MGTASTQRPKVELHVGREVPAFVRPLVRELSQWVDLRVPDAHRVTKGRLVVALNGLPDDGLAAATAYVVEPTVAPPPIETVGMLLVDWDALDDAPFGAIPVPPRVGAASSRRCIPPAVRARWRRRAGLPERFTVCTGDRDASGDPLVDTALATAAAVWATGATAEVALALGAPLVTDAPTAARCRLRAGVDAFVVDDADVEPALNAIAADEYLAAGLSRAGRAAAERLDLRSVARRLTIELGWVTHSAPVHRLAARLDELGTPSDAAVRSRVLAAELFLSTNRGA